MSRVMFSTSTSSSALNYKRLKIKIIITNLQNYELGLQVGKNNEEGHDLHLLLLLPAQLRLQELVREEG